MLVPLTGSVSDWPWGRGALGWAPLWLPCIDIVLAGSARIIVSCMYVHVHVCVCVLLD